MLSFSNLDFLFIRLTIYFLFLSVLSFLQFFNTEPYACDPSSLPKYPPTKEMDVKRRDDEARRYVLLCLLSAY
jgi:hypothetical protein